MQTYDKRISGMASSNLKIIEKLKRQETCVLIAGETKRIDILLQDIHQDRLDMGEVCEDVELEEYSRETAYKTF